MSISHFIKNIIRHSLYKRGFHIGRIEFGQYLYRDLTQLLGPRPGVLFDVGANVGQTALKLSRQFPQSVISSFEPDPKTFNRLIEATRDSHKIRAYNLALGDKGEENAPLHLAEGSVGNSLLPIAENLPLTVVGGDWTRQIDSVNVTITTLDEFCQEHGVAAIDLLKIDTQGYELPILKGAKTLLENQRVKVIYLETEFLPLYQGQATFDDIYSFMLSHHYYLVELYTKHRNVDSSLVWCDALFIARQKEQ